MLTLKIRVYIREHRSSHMSFEEDAMPSLLARLREVSDVWNMTHDRCVFDHLEVIGSSRHRVAPESEQTSNTTKQERRDKKLKEKEDKLKEEQRKLQEEQKKLKADRKDLERRKQFIKDDLTRINKEIREHQDHIREWYLNMYKTSDELYDCNCENERSRTAKLT